MNEENVKSKETNKDDEVVYTVDVKTKEETSTSIQVWRSFEAVGVECSNVLESVFSDYMGIEFRFNNGIVQPFLYFKTGDLGAPNGKDDNRVRAFEALQVNLDKNNRLGLDALNIGNYVSQNKKHVITKAGKDILSNLVYCNKPKDYDWNSKFIEENVPTYANGRTYNTERIVMYGFDFVKLLRFIKVGGVKDIENDRKYVITINRIPCQRYKASGIYYNEILCININNMDEFNKIAEKYGVGIMPQLQMNGNIITGSTAI